MNILWIMLSSFILSMVPSVQAGLIDLNSWSEEGPGAGNWVVAGDNNSVLQTKNSSNPTFFISYNPFIDSKFTGNITVETTGDDDFIGFVFGYKSPYSDNGDAAKDFDFLLFDWKQGNQGSAVKGFHLARVEGDFSGKNIGHSNSTVSNPFWSHVDNIDTNSSFVTLDSLIGAGLGWADNTTYDFELTYQTNLIEIAIDGGAFDNQTIFSVAGNYEPGSFGFYNSSQNKVSYAGITETVAPAVTMSEPLPVMLFALGAAGLVFNRKNSKVIASLDSK
ncbi:MAG: hypothetical protein GY787_24510 [Alteromonadales bacterium]|nr:hypothetical protein [Alteromonadales bacterium]